MVSLMYPLLQAPELCSTATSPLKTHQEEQNQALSPPGKGPLAGVRSPSCGRQQASIRGARLHLPNVGGSGTDGPLFPGLNSLLHVLNVYTPSTVSSSFIDCVFVWMVLKLFIRPQEVIRQCIAFIYHITNKL